MNDELRTQIRNNLKLKDIYELLNMWKTNNRAEWSDITFEVLREILEERIGEVPPQDDPIFESKNNIVEDNGREEWELRLLNDENQPGLYNTQDVLKLRANINKVASATVILYILLGVLNFSFVRMLFQGVVLPTSEIIKSLPDILFTMLNVGFRIAITYFPLKALTHLLRILMEMEFQSRKTFESVKQ